MDTKIKYFLQSDFFILSISILLGFLCHFLVATETKISEKKVSSIKNNYANVIEFEPYIERKNN